MRRQPLAKASSHTWPAWHHETHDGGRRPARERLEEAEVVEPVITATLQSLEDDATKLVSLQFRLKGADSLARRILGDACTEEIPLEKASKGVSDVVRHTYCIESADYTSETKESLKSLEDKGYKVAKFKNLWSGDLYKGLNTKFVTPDGHTFEIRFHTPQSLEVKEQNHVYCEKTRAENATAEEVAEAERIEREQRKPGVPARRARSHLEVGLPHLRTPSARVTSTIA